MGTRSRALFVSVFNLEGWVENEWEGEQREEWLRAPSLHIIVCLCPCCLIMNECLLVADSSSFVSVGAEHREWDFHVRVWGRTAATSQSVNENMHQQIYNKPLTSRYKIKINVLQWRMKSNCSNVCHFSFSKKQILQKLTTEFSMHYC